MHPRTQLAKIWDAHVVADLGDNAYLLHVDRHLLHDLGGSRGLLDLKQRGLSAVICCRPCARRRALPASVCSISTSPDKASCT
jgi:homoaconitase/3-isopropylmalate dehydratase large subunit